MATVAEQALEACGEDKGRLLLLTTPLLEWVILRQLPVEARLSVSYFFISWNENTEFAYFRHMTFPSTLDEFIKPDCSC